MFCLWVRVSVKKWKRVGIYATAEDAWRYAPVHGDLGGREHCVLPEGVEPHPGYSKV